jgi:xanthine dehydrogenase YagR molybdenum-binding subunit
MMSIVKDALQAVAAKPIALAPDSFIPGGRPDPLIRHKHGLIGAPISRIDGPLKVAGKAPFAAEFPLEEMVYAALTYSTIARGRIADIDVSAAEAAPGVVLVMTHRNAPRLNTPPPMMSKPKAGGADTVPLMQDDRIHWNGQPVALVLAQTQEQADHAQGLIRVAYEQESPVTALAAAKANGTEQAMFMGQPLKLAIGDAEAMLAAAPHKVDARYTTPRHNHSPIELHGCTVAWEGDTLRVHDASQAVSFAASTIAHVFGIPEDQVRVTSPYVGGGFGSKLLWQHQFLAAAAAKLAGRPVRIVLSREGVFRIVGGRTLTEQRVAIGAQADGGFDALIHTGLVAMTPHNNMPEPFITPSKSIYAAKSFLLDVRTVRLNMVANTFMRAPGEAVGTFGLECAVDELAHALAMDPVELRIRNEPDKDPTSGLPFSQRALEQAWRDGAARFGWSRRQAPGARREGEWFIGLGCATGTYPYVRIPGGAARIVLTREGKATIAIAAHEMGMGTSTVQTQVAAERLGLPMEAITFDYADTLLPGVVLAGGSQQTASIGASVSAAHRALVEELLKLAGNDSPLAGLKPEEVGGMDAGLCALDDETRYESYASILTRAGRDEVSVEASASMPVETQHWSMHSHSALFCETRVNAVTGEIKVSRFLGAFDCGRILNAKTAASQFRGGIIMGLGLALMEDTQVDERSGRIMNPSLAEYHVPAHLDVPEIDVIWTDEPDPHTPMGARGRDRHHGRGRRRGQCGVQRHRQADPGSAPHAGQGALSTPRARPRHQTISSNVILR